MLRIHIELNDGEKIEREVTGANVLMYGISYSSGNDIGDTRTFFWEDVKSFRIEGEPEKQQIEQSLKFQKNHSETPRRLV